MDKCRCLLWQRTSYGNAQGFRLGLDKRGKLFVVDIHQDHGVYLSHPRPYLPRWSGVGRKPSKLISEQKPVQVNVLSSQLEPQDWKTYTFRQGSKGAMTRKVYSQPVYLWNLQSQHGEVVEKYTLLISCKPDGTEVKYSLANDIDNPAHSTLSEADLLFKQMNRYWVERAIQDCKDSLGMTDYQVRSWRAFYHHITLTIMALHYILIQKINHQQHLPLLSVADIKFALAMSLPRKVTSHLQIFNTIKLRHKQRQYDIDRHKT